MVGARSQRAVMVALCLVLSFVMGPVAVAAASPGYGASASAGQVIGAAASPRASSFVKAQFDCKEPPMPSAPLSTVGDGTKPENVNPASADPFTNVDVPLASVYGWQYHWVSYDTGCTPGSGFLPSAGANLGNFITEPIGGMAGAGHAIHSSVLNPTWLAPIDDAVEGGVREVQAGTWSAYVGLVLLLVAASMMWAAKSGRLDATVTAAVWAIIVMSVVTFVGNYPSESTKMMDGLISESAMMISNGFADRAQGPGANSGVEVQATIDRQWDAIVRSTAFETWANGAFGSADSSTAKEYGAEVFTATHLSWDEWDQVSEDPDGAGKEIIEAKQENFQEVAEEIQESDPYAYNHLTGNEWGSRLATAGIGVLAAALAMLFLVIAGIGMFVGFLVIRIAIMFSPAAGVIFLFEKTRPVAIGLLAKVGKYVIMGPIYLVAGLVVLKLVSAIAAAPALAWWMQILLFLVVSFVAWNLTRPAGGIPGSNTFRQYMRVAMGTILGFKLASRGQDNGEDEARPDTEGQDGKDSSPGGDRPVTVARPRPHVNVGDPARLGVLPIYDVHDAPSRPGPGTMQPAAVAISARRQRALSGSWPEDVARIEAGPLPQNAISMTGYPSGGGPAASQALIVVPSQYRGRTGDSVAGREEVQEAAAEGRLRNPSDTAVPESEAEPAGEVSQARAGGSLMVAPPERETPDPQRQDPVSGEVLDSQVDIEQVHEANLTYDDHNRPVFNVYRPPGRE